MDRRYTTEGPRTYTPSIGAPSYPHSHQTQPAYSHRTSQGHGSTQRYESHGGHTSTKYEPNGDTRHHTNVSHSHKTTGYPTNSGSHGDGNRYSAQPSHTSTNANPLSGSHGYKRGYTSGGDSHKTTTFPTDSVTHGDTRHRTMPSHTPTNAIPLMAGSYGNPTDHGSHNYQTTQNKTSYQIQTPKSQHSNQTYQQGSQGYKPRSHTSVGGSHSNVLGAPSYGNVLGAPSYGNVLGAPSYGNTLGAPSHHTSGGGSHSNTLGAPSYGNTLGAPSHPNNLNSFMQNPDERSKNMMTSKFAFTTPEATHIYATRVPMINETVSDHVLQRTKSLSDAERSAGSQYTDRDFPPNHSQLWGQSSQKPQSLGKHWDGLQFKTPTEIFGSNYHVLHNISPTDIVQGSGGTCYFLCALSAMAERPQLIERLFEYNSRSVSSKGVYGIWLNINGMWELVILDDYLAVDRGNNVFFSASPRGENEIWVSLLEKAYAKCFGSYNDTKGGDPVNAMRDLTGAPCKKLLDLSRNSDKKWRQLVEGLNKNMPCTCYTRPGTDDEEKDETGIVLGHAYALLDAKEVTDSRGRKDRIVKVRNPWGEWEWDGDWGDNSDRWTPELKRELGVQIRDDG